MELSFEIFISIGTILMIIVMLFCGKYYHIKVWKRIVTALFFTVAGVIGVKIMAFIEMGRWNGRSFFGAVLFTPILMVLFSYFIKETPSDILDICAPAEAIMLALMKVDCAIQGCCYGKVIRIDSDGNLIRFPSQVVECLTAILIFIILIMLIYRKKQRGALYYWYMILYGIVRFILNWLRETKPFLLGLPPGNFWALITFIAGGTLMIIHLTRKGNKSSIKL